MATAVVEWRGVDVSDEMMCSDKAVSNHPNGSFPPSPPYVSRIANHDSASCASPAPASGLPGALLQVPPRYLLVAPFRSTIICSSSPGPVVVASTVFAQALSPPPRLWLPSCTPSSRCRSLPFASCLLVVSHASLHPPEPAICNDPPLSLQLKPTRADVMHLVLKTSVETSIASFSQ